jgi:hypothetical protein
VSACAHRGSVVAFLSVRSSASKLSFACRSAMLAKKRRIDPKLLTPEVTARGISNAKLMKLQTIWQSPGPSSSSTALFQPHAHSVPFIRMPDHSYGNLVKRVELQTLSHGRATSRKLVVVLSLVVCARGVVLGLGGFLAASRGAILKDSWLSHPLSQFSAQTEPYRSI